MLVSQRPEAVLLLADGTLFRGRAIGAAGVTVGEICFNTGMTGYQEIFSDPSYTGQIMTMASPHIGNYGVKVGEEESGSVTIAGLVVKKFSEVWSRPGGSGSLNDHLKASAWWASAMWTRVDWCATSATTVHRTPWSVPAKWTWRCCGQG